MENNKSFRLGIAMAGAVSAGAYTAGVIDYLLETLQRWQDAKDRNRELGPDHDEYDPSIPMHDVIIDVMGGASAGGMTAAITAMSLFGGIDTNEWDHNKKKLYDTWVNLNDNAHPLPTMLQLLQNDDIQQSDEVPSLLNSTAIDEIADRAMQLGEVRELPPFICPNMELILTITSLRGIPIAVNFFDKNKKEDKKPDSRPTDLPAHKMYVHKGTAHFMLSPDGSPTPAHTVPFHPQNETARSLLAECAKATGAFPIGLKARKLEGIGLPYVKAMIYRMFEIDEEHQNSGALDIMADEDPFDLVAVDGGTINNEPFGEIIRALEEKQGEDEVDYAIIMIDPFPNFDRSSTTTEKAAYQHPSNILELVPNILGAIRGQAMVKERDIIRGLSDDHTRKMIFPKREGDPYPIACGSLDGFGGFFSRDFREHDYMLGRRNCQRFLQKHLTMPLDEAKESDIFSDWTQDNSDPRHRRFYVEPKVEGGQGAYPIVPDLNVEAMSRGLFYKPGFKEPDKPKIAAEDIFKLDQPIRDRLKEVMLYIFKTDQKTVDTFSPETRAYVSKLMDRHLPQSKSIFAPIINWAYKRFVTKAVAKRLSRMVIGEILLDFKKRNLLQ